jgi:NAD(P) transhydrogenase
MGDRSRYDLVCIGSGPAGQRAAVQAAKLGKRVAVVEKHRAVGGVCIETGTIPSKTFREAVFRLYSRPGLETSDSAVPVRPTMAQLVEHVGRVVEREVRTVQSQLERNDVELVRGRASFVDPHTIEVGAPDGHRRLDAANILIACGTKPGQPEGATVDGETVVTSDNVLGIPRLPRTMAVVGAGVIGIEYASMFAALGVQVTVIDQRERPLEFLDHEIVDELIHQLRKSDVTLRCGESVDKIDVVSAGDRKGLIRLDSNKHLVADVILLAAGRVGATDDLRLDAVGLEADTRGRLSVDAHYRTVVPHIYAAGDVIGFPALAATSSEQGRLAACHMFGAAAEPMGAHFPVGIYAIPEVSMVGATEEDLTRAKVPYETGVARYKEIARGQICGDDSGMFKMIFHRDTTRLLGVHCIGSSATELVHVGQAVLALGGGLDYFLTTVFNYPTLAECYKVAAYNAANKLVLVRSLTAAEAAGLSPRSAPVMEPDGA